MSDDADRAETDTQDALAEARARAKLALDNTRLRPIIQVMDGVRFGICHYCASEIQPTHLFCPTDTIEPEHSCAVLWERERQRKADMGW